MCFLRHAFFSRVKETGCVVIGRAWEGVAIKHTDLTVQAGLGDQTNPVRPSRWRVVGPSSGRLPGKLQAADKKEEQHLAFCEKRGPGE